MKMKILKVLTYPINKVFKFIFASKSFARTGVRIVFNPLRV